MLQPPYTYNNVPDFSHAMAAGHTKDFPIYVLERP